MWLLWWLACAGPWSTGDYAEGRAELWCGRQAECYGLQPDDTCVDDSTQQWLSLANESLELGCTFSAELAQDCVEEMWDMPCNDFATETSTCQAVFDCPS